MTTLTETLHAGAFIVSEANGNRSRAEITVALSQTLVAGQVIGKLGVVAGITSSVTADAGNTGNGVFTLANPAISAAAKDGKYTVRIVEPAANAGAFQVEDPEGRAVGEGTVGVAFDGEIKFTLADGATDFVVNDSFTVTIGRETEKDEQWKVLAPAAADGTEIASGILFDAVATDGVSTKRATAIVRQAEVRGSDLTWPGSITAIQKATAIEQLLRQGIVIR
jgi:Bacteriophage lambda head decoration protein D